MFADLLVIGSGIAGLAFTIKVANENPEVSIILISKRTLMEGNTRYAQGGIAVVSNFKKDSYQKHINDTLVAGAGECNPKVVRFVVEEANERLHELIEWGTQFDIKGNQLHLAKEGGHSEKRIVHYKDKTGLQVQEALIKKVRSFPNVTLLENHVLVDLITDHHTKSKFNRCYGAYVISVEKQEIVKITSRITALSTGGAGSLYAHSTNPASATGDGLGAAYRAKVQISGLPYVQFHPTVLYPKINGNSFLITEAVRGAGGILRNVIGERFMLKYDHRAELASRDIVARAIQIEIQKSPYDYALLDCSSFSEQTFTEHFPTIFKTCQKLKINLPEDPIPIVPAAHYFCGGIKVNEYGASELDGLYAIGECSSTGLHGANRLASNSLLEILVFSHRSAKDALESLKGKLPPLAFYETIPNWHGEQYISNDKIKAIGKLRLKLQKTMTEKMGVFKTDRGMEEAERELIDIYLVVQELYKQSKLTSELCELRNMVSIAYLLIKQAQQIKTNKGVFYNEDNEI